MLFGTSQKLSRLQKTLTISYKYNNINVVTTYKYLGIEIDGSLNLNSHFEKSYKRASGRLNLLSKMRYQINSNTAETIYKSMILPVFNYCCLLLLKQSNTHTSRCKAFEVRACKIIRNGGEHVKIDVPTLEGFKKRRACEFVRKCLDSTIGCTNFDGYFDVITHEKLTRNNAYSLRLPKIKTEYGRKSVKFMAARIYNDLPLYIRSEKSFSKFSSLVKLHFAQS